MLDRVTERKIEQLLDGYRYKTGVDYAFYRVFNAVKHIFGRSDYDKARRVVRAALRGKYLPEEDLLERILEVYLTSGVHMTLEHEDHFPYELMSHFLTFFENNLEKLSGLDDKSEEPRLVELLLKDLSINPHTDFSKRVLVDVIAAFNHILKMRKSEKKPLFPLDYKRKFIDDLKSAALSNNAVRVRQLLAPMIARYSRQRLEFLSRFLALYRNLQIMSEGTYAKRFDPLDLFPENGDVHARETLQPIMDYLLKNPGIILL